MKRTITSFIIIIFVGAICYIAYTLYTHRPLSNEAGASTSEPSTTNTTDTQQNNVVTNSTQTASIAVNQDFFLSSFDQTGFPSASAVIGDKVLSATITVPTNPDGTIQGDPQVLVSLPSDITYPSEMIVSLVAPDSSVKLQTSITLTRKNQPAITDADWTPTAN